jgi:hypothetical protein
MDVRVIPIEVIIQNNSKTAQAYKRLFPPRYIRKKIEKISIKFNMRLLIK